MASRMLPATFSNGPIEIVGDIHLPPGFDRDARYPAIVIVTPGSSVRGQIGANYARRLAQRGFLALAFDPSCQGQSGGEPRDLESPAARIEDVRCAIDHLVTLPFVDEGRIGLLGICAGGGYAASAAMIERRVKALATVVPVDIGRAFRHADPAPDALERTLRAVALERTAVARGAAARRETWLPDSEADAAAAGIADPDVLDAVNFYRTPRGFDPHSTNRLWFGSMAAILGFDAFHLASRLLVQPLQVVVGGRLGTTFSYEDGRRLFELAPRAKDFFVVDGAGHYDLYDRPEHVDPAVERLAAFFTEHLPG